MRLPRLDNPQRYAGLFVVDFGETCSVGYTAEEVALLMESEAHADAKVYRIHNAYPDGTMELKGVPRNRFALEAGCNMIVTMTGEAVPGDPQHSYSNILKQGFEEAYLRENWIPADN